MERLVFITQSLVLGSLPRSREKLAHRRLCSVQRKLQRFHLLIRKKQTMKEIHASVHPIRVQACKSKKNVLTLAGL